MNIRTMSRPLLTAASNKGGEKYERGEKRVNTYEKHKKADMPVNEEKLDNALQELKKAVLTLSGKQQNIISEWLFVWARYLNFEKSFKPDRLKYYKRGDIVHLHLGYNVGNEQGGAHYAVVMDNNNNRASGCVVVVPISSLESGKSADSLHGSEVYLGKIIPGSDIESYAQPLQIRCVSKLRIIKPKAEKDMSYTLNAEQMDNIDRKIIEIFTKKST